MCLGISCSSLPASFLSFPRWQVLHWGKGEDQFQCFVFVHLINYIFQMFHSDIHISLMSYFLIFMQLMFSVSHTHFIYINLLYIQFQTFLRLIFFRERVVFMYPSTFYAFICELFFIYFLLVQHNTFY